MKKNVFLILAVMSQGSLSAITNTESNLLSAGVSVVSSVVANQVVEKLLDYWQSHSIKGFDWDEGFKIEANENLNFDNDTKKLLYASSVVGATTISALLAGKFFSQFTPEGRLKRAKALLRDLESNKVFKAEDVLEYYERKYFYSNWYLVDASSNINGLIFRAMDVISMLEAAIKDTSDQELVGLCSVLIKVAEEHKERLITIRKVIINLPEYGEHYARWEANEKVVAMRSQAEATRSNAAAIRENTFFKLVTKK